MARIKMILEDDNGNVINSKEMNYDLDLTNSTFHSLEGEIDNFKKNSSKELTAIFLEHLQCQVILKKNQKGGH